MINEMEEESRQSCNQANQGSDGFVHGDLTRGIIGCAARAHSPATGSRDSLATAHYRLSFGGKRMIKEHDCVVLTQDLPEEGLRAGDIGTVVHIHEGAAGYEVEFMTLAGETVAVVTLLPSQLRPIARRDLAHVRELTAT